MEASVTYLTTGQLLLSVAGEIRKLSNTSWLV